MRCAVALSTDDQAVAAAEQVCADVLKALNGSRPDLAMVFVSIHDVDVIEAIVQTIHDRVAPGLLLGCTAEGVIGGDQEIERQPAVSLWAAHLPGVHLAPFHLTFHEAANGFGLSGWPETMPVADTQPAFLLLAEPHTTPGHALLNFLNQQCPAAPAVGGMASGGMDAGENRVILNHDVFEGGVVGVALTGAVKVLTVVSQGCRPIGDRFIVTKAERNLVQELSGRPALTCLQEVFGSLSPEDQRLARQALHLGCAMNEYQERFGRGDFLIKNLVGVDSETGAIALADIVQEGQTVQFHIRDAKTASEDLHQLLKSRQDALGTHPAGGALLFSCNGRGQRLFQTPHHDVGTVRAELGQIPVAGFFAQGEIGPIGGTNFLHGFTASIALFCQESTVVNRR